jgi:hypothetical protein
MHPVPRVETKEEEEKKKKKKQASSHFSFTSVWGQMERGSGRWGTDDWWPS